MKIFRKGKDGGDESNATGYWIVEIKCLFSLVILKFNGKSRTNFHSHAFNALTWFLCGDMTEVQHDGTTSKYRRALMPKFTSRDMVHKVDSNGVSWCFSIRGPWKKEWLEYNPNSEEWIVLKNKRKVVRVFK